MLVQPTLIVFSSAVLADAIRHVIENEFGIPVFSSYQAVEALKIGFECERHRGIHLNIDICPVRIVDGSGHSLPDGETGDVVVSNLVNRATILLNYRLGDLASILPENCSCGRQFPLLSFPQGRNDDLLELPSGREIHPQAVCRIFRDEPQIWQYRIIQETPSRIRVALVASDSIDRASIKERVISKLSRILEEQIELDVNFTSSIAPTAGGKSRAVLSLWKNRHVGDKL